MCGFRTRDWASRCRKRCRAGGPTPGDRVTTSDLDPTEILETSASVITAIVAAAREDRAARAQVEALFDMLTHNGWRVVEPIQRIWTGERDEGKLTAGMDDADELIVREILRRLVG